MSSRDSRTLSGSLGRARYDLVNLAGHGVRPQLELEGLLHDDLLGGGEGGGELDGVAGVEARQAARLEVHDVGQRLKIFSC